MRIVCRSVANMLLMYKPKLHKQISFKRIPLVKIASEWRIRMEQQTERLYKLGKLSKLKVSENDKKLSEDLEKIISYIDVIRAVDTTGIEPLSHMQFIETTNGEKRSTESATSQNNPMEGNVFREDELALENAQRNREGEPVLEKVPMNTKNEHVVDKVCFNRNELLKNAPKTEQGYLVVPKTVTE